MNEGQLKYEIAMDYNASGGDQAKHHIESIKSGYLAFNQFLRGDVIGSIHSANRALQGFSTSLSATLGLVARFAGPLLAGFTTGKLLDSAFGISDKIAASIVPAIKLNTEMEKSLEQLRDLNKAKLDAVTKEFSTFGETVKKAADHTMALLQLTNQANLNKAPTPTAQYSVGQTGNIDVVKALVKTREQTADRLKTVEQEYLSRINHGRERLDRQIEAAPDVNNPGMARHYRIEKENYDKATKDLEPVIIDLSKSLELLDKQIEATGSEITKSSREMSQERDRKIRESSAEMTQMEADGRTGAAESLSADPRPMWEKLRDKYTKPFETQTDDEKQVQVAKRKYDYGQMDPKAQLAQTEREIEQTRRAAASKKINPEERSALQRDYYERLAPERDRLKKEIAVPDLKAEGTRADKIKAAQDNISTARKRQVSGASMGDVFSRMHDIQKGRTPQDAAAQQTAENTKIIAENTNLLRQLGVVK